MPEGLLNVGDRIASYTRLLRKYVSTHAGDMATMRRQLAAAETEEALRLAHSLKGVSATLGVRGIQAAAETLEAAIRAGQSDVEIEATVVSGRKCLVVAGG